MNRRAPYGTCLVCIDGRLDENGKCQRNCDPALAHPKRRANNAEKGAKSDTSVPLSEKEKKKVQAFARQYRPEAKAPWGLFSTKRSVGR